MYGTNITRVSGMASGMDTESLVKKLMDAERIPVNKMKQSREKLGWQSDAYRQWNTDIFSFRSKTLFDMKLSKTYSTFNVSSSDSTKVTATANADVLPGNHKLVVDQIAQGASFTGTTKIDTTKKLKDQDTVNGYRGLSADASLKVTVTDAKGITHESTITIKADGTIADAVNAFNSARDAGNNSLGIQAAYDGNLGQFILQTKETGQKTQIKIDASATGVINDNKQAFYVLGLDKDNTAANQPSILDTNVTAAPVAATDQELVAKKGQDAQVKLDGNTIASTFSSNNIILFGINYALKDVTGAAGVSISVTQDVEAEVKNIKDFIDKYNEILDKANKAVDEPVYKKYQPLTDEERKTLDQKQIEQWEQKAKSGLLRRDSLLSGLANNIRTSMMSTVDNGSKYNSLSSIGIKTDSYKDKGKLTVDEDKLRKALQEDPEAVKNLFVQGSDITADDVKNDPTKQGKRGLIHRLYDQLGDTFSQMTKKAGITGNAQNDESIVGKMLQNLDKRINDGESRLIDRENRYYRQFAAMEKAMSQYNSQSSWLTQQFAGGK